MDINLTDYGIQGDKLIFRCWEADFIGKASTVHEKLVNPHNALDVYDKKYTVGTYIYLF